ncbi:MAG: hypothetical protein ABI131_04725 [Nostocoides sp.]
MRIDFDVAGARAQLAWNGWTGRLGLAVGDRLMLLQNPWSPRTQLSLGRTRNWQVTVDEHAIEVQKRRPLMFAGFRPSDFTVRVDGHVAARQTGR